MGETLKKVLYVEDEADIRVIAESGPAIRRRNRGDDVRLRRPSARKGRRLRLLDVLGEDNVMWGSDYPPMDGVWPHSQEFIETELGHLPARTRAKIACDNAARLYGFLDNKVN